MTPPPLISAIIPIYNTAAYIGQMLDSLLAQSHPAIEIILVDDGSTDDLEAALTAYKDKIKHFIQQNNQGVSAARNRGMALAQGDYFIFLDSDDWLPDPLSLAAMVEVLEAQPEVAAVTGGWREYTGPAQIEDHSPWQHYPEISPYLIFERFPIRLWATMIRRNAALAVGPFAVQLSQYEDIDWAVRFCLNGYKFIWLQKIVYVYRLHPQSLTKRASKEAHKISFAYFQNLRQNPGWPPDFLSGQEQTFFYYKFLLLAMTAFHVGDMALALDIFRQALIEKRDHFFLRQLMSLALEFHIHFPAPYEASEVTHFILEASQVPAQTPLGPSGIPLQVAMDWWLEVWPRLANGQQTPKPSDTALIELSLLLHPTLFYPQPEVALDLLAKLGGGKRSRWANLVFWRAFYSRQWAILSALLPQLLIHELASTSYAAVIFRRNLKKWPKEMPHDH